MYTFIKQNVYVNLILLHNKWWKDKLPVTQKNKKKKTIIIHNHYILKVLLEQDLNMILIFFYF